MYRFLQRHGKKLMAVFSALLMVGWVFMPSQSRSGGGPNPTVGTIGDTEKLTARDVAEARMSWEVLKNTPIKGNPQQRLAMALPQPALGEIETHPQLFVLLLKEAKQMGVTVGNDQLNDALINAVDLDAMDDDRAANVRVAINDLLLINNAFQRAASTVKVSDPMVKHTLAQERQSIIVNL